MQYVSFPNLPFGLQVHFFYLLYISHYFLMLITINITQDEKWLPVSGSTYRRLRVFTLSPKQIKSCKDWKQPSWIINEGNLRQIFIPMTKKSDRQIQGVMICWSRTARQNLHRNYLWEWKIWDGNSAEAQCGQVWDLCRIWTKREGLCNIARITSKAYPDSQNILEEKLPSCFSSRKGKENVEINQTIHHAS